MVKLLKDTMVENEPEGKQELDVRKPSSVPAVGRRASTAHARKSILRLEQASCKTKQIFDRLNSNFSAIIELIYNIFRY